MNKTFVQRAAAIFVLAAFSAGSAVGQSPSPSPSPTATPSTTSRILGALTGLVDKIAPKEEPTPVPLSPEMQKKASDLVKTYGGSIVFVSGKDAAGSGFIASIQGKNYLVTNAHVAAGVHDATFKTLNDTTVRGGVSSLAVGRDLFCVAVATGGQPLPVMDDMAQNAAIGDEVVVLGNAEGQGVVNLITGRITGIGPDRVEVDAPFVPGSSGSPIIHLKSGKVIGVATYMAIKYLDPATQEILPHPIVRRFGFRLDNVKQWQMVDTKAFAAQAAEMENIETLTEDLYGVCEGIANGMEDVTPEDFKVTEVKNCLDQWYKAGKAAHSDEERKKIAANMLGLLKNMTQGDVTAARQRMAYDYFKRELAEQQDYRDAFAKMFDSAVKNINR
ncbi:MAG TPA: serine protease [Chthoniobacteraceae bacterium]|nr:serine protease [Chthoniobacteraceae bacterium]